MRVVEIIPSKAWHHKPSGRTASIYGACPWTSAADEQDWELIVRGYTWRLDNGTIGLCRIPAKTLEEAREVMARFNNNL